MPSSLLPPVTRLAGVLFALGWLSLASWSAPPANGAVGEEAPPTRRILVVFESDPTQPAAIEITDGLRTTLAKGVESRLETYIEYLDAQRFSAAEHLERQASVIAQKYRNLQIDVAIGMGPAAVAFLSKHHDRIAPGAALVFGAVREESLRGPEVPSSAMGVASHFDLEGTVDLARRLQPTARRMVVLTGSADFDRRWQETARQAFADLSGQLDVEYLSGLTIEGFEDSVSKLPPDNILLILTVIEDAGGERLIPREVAGRLAAAASAPSYGVYSTFVGQGIVGGRVETFHSVGEDAAALAIDALEGKAVPGRIITSAAKPIVDWRQMVRWGLDRGDLPEGAEIRNYQPSVWEQYRLQILAIAAVIILQSATIAALITMYRRHKRIGGELALERLELAHLSRVHQLGELSGAFAHELNQPLTSILANAEVGARLLKKEPVDNKELGAIFADIVADDRRAAGIIAQLRSLMVKGEARLHAIDLNRTIGSTITLANSELVARQTKVSFDDQQKELKVRGNVAQLQQLVLNLLLNAADAMSSLPVTDRRVEIETRKRDDGACEMAVSDRGPGVSADLKSEVFKPFVSTKENGLGLGLAICHSIARAHGGTLQFDDGRKTGARVVLTLPSY